MRAMRFATNVNNENAISWSVFVLVVTFQTKQEAPE